VLAAIVVADTSICLPLTKRNTAHRTKHKSSSPTRFSSRPYIGVSAGVRPSSLLLGQGSDEFAAELGDVGDHAAPDRVGSGRETLEQVFAGLLRWSP
jgi:hypothetical protein